MDYITSIQVFFAGLSVGMIFFGRGDYIPGAGVVLGLLNLAVLAGRFAPLLP